MIISYILNIRLDQDMYLNTLFVSFPFTLLRKNRFYLSLISIFEDSLRKNGLNLDYLKMQTLMR